MLGKRVWGDFDDLEGRKRGRLRFLRVHLFLLANHLNGLVVMLVEAIEELKNPKKRFIYRERIILMEFNLFCF